MMRVPEQQTNSKNRQPNRSTQIRKTLWINPVARIARHAAQLPTDMPIRNSELRFWAYYAMWIGRSMYSSSRRSVVTARLCRNL